MAYTFASSFWMMRSMSTFLSWSIMTARFTIRVLNPAASRWEDIVMNPMGYISNTGDEGTTSLTGP